jgi:hypothetical protein
VGVHLCLTFTFYWSGLGGKDLRDLEGGAHQLVLKESSGERQNIYIYQSDAYTHAVFIFQLVGYFSHLKKTFTIYLAANRSRIYLRSGIRVIFL